VADSSARFGYRFAGEALASDLRLPSLGPPVGITAKGFSASNASIHLPAGAGPVHSWTLPGRADNVYLWLYKDLREYIIDAPGFGRFAVRERSLLVDWSGATVPAPVAEHFLLNQILPMFLAQHGRLILHAAVVRVAGVCLAFTGETGIGKSTLAAAFAAAGAEVLTDDGVVISTEQTPVSAAATYRNLRLLPDSLAHFAGAGTGLSSGSTVTAKQEVALPRRRRSAGRFWPLAAVYCLQHSTRSAADVVVQDLTPREACMRLLGQSFQLDVTDGRTVARVFAKVARLADAVPCFTLSYPRCFERLPEVTSTVLRHSAPWRERPSAGAGSGTARSRASLAESGAAG
jgi:hypothetical protein